MDIPKRNINAGHGSSTNDSRSMPKMLTEHHLPDVFNPSRILSKHERANIFDRANDRSCVPFQRCLIHPLLAAHIGRQKRFPGAAWPRVAMRGTSCSKMACGIPTS